MSGRKSRALQTYQMYLTQAEVDKLYAAIHSDDTATVARWNAIVEERRAAHQVQLAEERTAATEKRKDKRVVIIGISAMIVIPVVGLTFFKAPEASESDRIQLHTSGPCDTSVTHTQNDRQMAIGGMKVNQTGWVTYWMVAHDREGDWIDTNADAWEAGGGTANVCIQRTDSGWEAWMGPDAISGDRTPTTGPKPNWVPAKIHPQGQK